MKQEKTGRIADIIFHNETNMYSILGFETEDEQFTAVGYMPRPQKGRSFRLLGDWVEHPRFGEQFAFSEFEEIQPTTEEGIESFLSSGVIKGVGASTARAIVRYFGKETLEVLSNPDMLTRVSGIGKKKAQAIAAAYAEHREYAETVMALSAFDISPSVCLRLYKIYGPKAVDIVRENPYSLIADIWGIGFRKADAIARKLGFDEDSPFRIKSGIEYYLNERANSGDTYVEKTVLLEDVAGFLDVTRDQAGAALEDQVMDGRVFLEMLGGLEIVMLHRFYVAEKRVAAKLYELCHSELRHIGWNMDRLIAKTEKESGIELSDKQKNAVVSSIKNGVSVITGGPGTGKTTIINTILKILEAADISTALAAPTGRAAKRMSQTTGADAKTIHRLLEYSYQSGEDVMRFGRNAENPLEFDCVIVDEMSMVDILLMDGLLAAVKPGTRLILVGDADQLPPVGAGNVLRDILSSGTVHSVRLTEIFRQAAESMIVVNAHLINRGEY
ncbi:MAG: AAA family ATPase, partial [Firmicutes bacterium]|nr:AAA family ATPase [Bacillota bacterium]